MHLHMRVLFLQTPRDGKVASGAQVVFHEARVDPDLVTRLDRRHITGSTGGLLQSYTFLKCHSLLNIVGIALQILLLQFSCQFSSVTGIWMYLDNKGVASRATIQPCWLTYWVSNSFTWGSHLPCGSCLLQRRKKTLVCHLQADESLFLLNFLREVLQLWHSQSFKVTVMSCLLVFPLKHNHKSVTLSQQPVLWLKRLSLFFYFNKNVQFVWLFYWKISLGEKKKDFVKCLLQFVW